MKTGEGREERERGKIYREMKVGEGMRRGGNDTLLECFTPASVKQKKKLVSLKT